MPPADAPEAAAVAPAPAAAPAVGVADEELDVFGANVNDVGNGEPSGDLRDSGALLSFGLEICDQNVCSGFLASCVGVGIREGVQNNSFFSQ